MNDGFWTPQAAQLLHLLQSHFDAEIYRETLVNKGAANRSWYPPQPVGIFWLKNRTLSPMVKLFIEHAREVAKSTAKNR